MTNSPETSPAQHRVQSDSGIGKKQKNRINAYYREAGPDYETWSKAYNMHYGYFRKGLNPFCREPMLNQMTKEVFDRLKLNAHKGKTVLDMGCGVGASARYLAKKYKNLSIHGISIVPWQIEKAKAMNHKVGLTDRINLVEGDFTKTGFKDNSFDGLYAIESACHAPGNAKMPFAREAFRILKPGGKLVVADGFIKNPHLPFSSFTKKAYETLCQSWALPQMAEIELFTEALKSVGFRKISVEDISWRVAPSVAHSPFLILKFLFMKWLKGEHLGRQSWNNLKGVFLTNVLGLKRKKFGYYLVTAEK